MMLLLEDRRFYVYVYLNPRKLGKYKYGEYKFEYEPFYIGKGCGRRIYSSKYRDNTNSFKHNKIEKLKRQGFEPIAFKYMENLTEREAVDFEIKLIETIGRRNKKLGPLVNLTYGGEGHSGYIADEELRKKRRINAIGKKNPFYGRHHSEETKRNIGNRHRGKYISDETKRKQSENHHWSRSLFINDKFYRSIKDAGKKLNIHIGILRYRIKNNLINYKFVVPDEEYFSKHTRRLSNNNNKKGISRPIIIDDEYYCSIREASKKLNINYSTIGGRLINNNFINYKFKVTNKKYKRRQYTTYRYNRRTSKQIIIDNKIYNSIKEASEKLNVKYDFIRYRLKNKNFPNYKYASAA